MTKQNLSKRPLKGEDLLWQDEPVHETTAKESNGNPEQEPIWPAVYMVQCADGSYYTGWTYNVKKRLEAHNGRIPGGAKYTKTRRPVRLVWHSYCAHKRIAQTLEYTIKQWSHFRKANLVARRAQEWNLLMAKSVAKGESLPDLPILEGGDQDEI